LLIGAYAGLSHYCIGVAGSPDLGATLALTPVISVALILAWRETPAGVALALTAGLAGLIHGLWRLLTQNFALIYLLEDSAVYGLLGLTFSLSLLRDRVAVCTRLADKVHGPLTAQEVRYTRRVTVAWAVFFFTVAAVSIELFRWAPLRIWSLYANFCVLPLVGAMFLSEYLVRRRILPRGRRTGLLATVRVYLANPQ
jgi:uncharacterized membrane protein